MPVILARRSFLFRDAVRRGLDVNVVAAAGLVVLAVSLMAVVHAGVGLPVVIVALCALHVGAGVALPALGTLRSSLRAVRWLGTTE